MNDEMIFQQMHFIRNRTVAALDATTEEMADIMPEGFNNSIRWNLGHIFVAQERLIHGFVQEEPQLPPHYVEWFNANTSPETWDKDAPTLSELREHLVQQPKRLEDKFKGRLSEKGPQPFKLGEDTVFTTLAEVVSFANWHEGLHQGTITSLKRAQGAEKLFEVSSGK
ncbi:DinB family protein [Pontibacillus sp. HMF3514]|uniref:DinB family protein n=1 Tax=Pontibacillus sp. HMF3514 TaxID=2692425 RepID=UPI00131FA536|nr:DinB family protein [Pontibacillus sp. HMF3514]QHE54016.1 DinB family protein [Pontibacillus sp. HMF3514]